MGFHLTDNLTHTVYTTAVGSLHFLQKVKRARPMIFMFYMKTTIKESVFYFCVILEEANYINSLSFFNLLKTK